MQKRTPVTQADLARHLGIDQSTVSRAFTDPDLVAVDLRQRITAAAMQLGYRTNRMARATRLGRTEHLLIVQGIGVSVSTLHSEILAGLHDAVDDTGLHLGILRLADAVLTDEARLPAVLRDLSADGLLLNYEIHTPPPLTGIIERHAIPAVWMNVEREVDAVRPDDRQAGQMLTQHLLELGHRRIAYVDLLLLTDTNSHVSRGDRLAGYREAMADAGLPSVCLAPDASLGRVPSASYLRDRFSAERSTAAVCYGHADAMAAAMAALALGLAIPTQMSIAGVSEFQMTGGYAFTTAVNPFKQLGRRAVEMLRQRIAQPSRHLLTERLPYTLTHGATCAPPPPA